MASARMVLVQPPDTEMTGSRLRVNRSRLSCAVQCWITPLVSILGMCCILFCPTAFAQSPPAVALNLVPLEIKVVDENGLAVPSAQVSLRRPEISRDYRAQTDYLGNLTVSVPLGAYSVHVQKEGFYLASFDIKLQPHTSPNFELQLTHQQEARETVTVSAAAPAIDPSKVEQSQTLTASEIVNVPYPTTRDLTRALALIPGVLLGPDGQLHVAGAPSDETLYVLDGFNITQPFTQIYDVRISPDALRTVEAQTSRSPAEYGKATGGVLSLTSGMGDDRFRLSITNFVPSVKLQNGLNFDKFVPRATISGPIKRGKAWFFDAADAEYTQEIFSDSPRGSDRNWLWRANNLARSQLNITTTNSLTGSFLVNRFHSNHAGMSAFNPASTTPIANDSVYIGDLKDQQYFDNGVLLELGADWERFNSAQRPLSVGDLVIAPQGNSGTYFQSSDERGRRVEGIAQIFLPELEWHGKHQLKTGLDIDDAQFSRALARESMLIVRQDGTLARRMNFPAGVRYGNDDPEVGAFLQDNWSLNSQLIVDAGLRFDWSTLLTSAPASPRLAVTYRPFKEKDTKLSAGIGAYHGRPNLDLLSRASEGVRTDFFFGADGVTLLSPPQQTSFFAPKQVQAPRSVNASFELEQRLPGSIYFDLQLLQRHLSRGLSYVNGTTDLFGGLFALTNGRKDRYESAQVTVRRTFRQRYMVFAAYTRSSAHSNAALSFDLDNPFLGQQAPGPLSWDTPNRVVSWGWLPLTKRLDVAYSMEFRNGFPFSAVNQFEQLVGQPNSFRFPAFFSLNLHLERRFHVRGRFVAVRIGVEDLTGNKNASVVNNNIDSSQFGTFSGTAHRALTTRIRLLGKE